MWIDDTKSISLSQYEASKTRFFNAFENNNDIIDYGQFGSINAPGLSDLDLCIIVNDDSLSHKSLSLPSPQGEIEEYIFHHPPLIIPASLLSSLPYYHLINVEWNKQGHSVQEIPDWASVAAINVFFKTTYLQSLFWYIKTLRHKKCKRAILGLTSLVRSIEWMGKIGFSATNEEKAYSSNILNYRDSWIGNTISRNSLIKQLDSYLDEAIEISIELPEKLLANILETSAPTTNSSRYLFDPSACFVFESTSQDPKHLIQSIHNSWPFSPLCKILDKYSPLLMGKISFVRPLSYALVLFELNLVNGLNNYAHTYTSGENPEESILNRIDMTLGETLKKRAKVNMAFAEKLRNGGFSGANFGSIQLPDGRRDSVLKLLSYLTGRLGITPRTLKSIC